MTPLSPITHLRLDLFLLGVIAACSFLAALYFWRFWKSTRDSLFMAFSAFFLVQGITHASVLDSAHPNEGGLWIFLLRLFSVLGVLAAIFWKNR